MAGEEYTEDTESITGAEDGTTSPGGAAATISVLSRGGAEDSDNTINKIFELGMIYLYLYLSNIIC